MLYVFTGPDTAGAKAEARKRAGDAEVVRCGEGGVPFERATSYVGAAGLFAPNVALLIDRPFETADGKAFVAEHAAHLHASDTPVFVITGPLKAPEKKLFPARATFQDFAQAAVAPTRLNIFGIADVFLSGDRKKLWIAYQQLITEGIPPEEIHGVLSWAVRSALIASKTQSATASGLKPFVYTKSKRAAEKLGNQKLEAYSRALVRTYHDARSGKGTMALNLEAFLLEK